jgi:hypothetical protein
VGQRSRLASESEIRSLRQARREKSPFRPGPAAFRNVLALVLLAALACALLPAFSRPHFLFDLARDAVAFAMAVGEWLRSALAAAFQSIPVR